MTSPTGPAAPRAVAAHPHHGPRYDRWERYGPITTWDSPQAFASAGRRGNGVHRIETAAGVLDVFVRDDPLASDAGPTDRIPVALGGRREDAPVVHGPHFSALSIAERLGLPFLAIADPTLTRHLGVRAAIYAGCATADVAGALAGLLECITEQSGREVLLIGGSASGYAALHQGTRLGSRAVVFAWSPVTDLAGFASASTDAYLELCFPGHGLPATTTVEDLDDVRRFFESQGIETRAWRGAGSEQVFVLHNVQDRQVDAQVRAYAEALDLRREHDRWDGPGRCVSVAAWGAGHTAPPIPVMLTAVRCLAGGRDVAEIHAELRARSPELFLTDAAQQFLAEPRFEARRDEATGVVTVEPEIEVAAGPWLGFAYYLMAGATRLATRWYDGPPGHTFDGPEAAAADSVTCFVRDHDGHVVVRTVPV